jgi:hypothetical protein
MASNNINHQGLLIALLILALMSFSCHISNFYYYISKRWERFGDMSKYNEITYLNLNDCSGIPCDRILEESHPGVSCEMLEKCIGKKKALDPEHEKILLLTKLRMAGREVMNRGVRKIFPKN